MGLFLEETAGAGECADVIENMRVEYVADRKTQSLYDEQRGEMNSQWDKREEKDEMRDGERRDERRGKRDRGRCPLESDTNGRITIKKRKQRFWDLLFFQPKKGRNYVGRTQAGEGGTMQGSYNQCQQQKHKESWSRPEETMDKKEQRGENSRC